MLALAQGDFDETDAKVIGTSLLFALATTLAAAGVTAAAASDGTVVLVGRLTVAATALAFLGVLAGIWVEPGGEAFWRATIALSLLCLEGAHASFLLARRRTTDTGGVAVATGVALAATVVSTVGTVIPAVVPLDPPDDQIETWAKLLGVVLVVQLVGTVVASLLRRLDGAPADRPLLAPEEPLERLRREVTASAGRLERSDDALARAEASRLLALVTDEPLAGPR